MSVSDLQAQLLRPLGSVKAEAAFHFISRGKIERQLQVAQFKGQERVSTPHEFDIEVIAPQDIDPLTTLEEGVLGHPGTLVMGMENGETRAVHGLVTAYEVLRAFDGHTVRVRLRLSARISALKLRHTSRIFQELTIPEIVS